MPASAAGRAARGADAPLAVTMGDPAGIGPEITLRAYQHRRELGLAPFAVSPTNRYSSFITNSSKSASII